MNERTVQFGSAGELLGTLCLPAAPATPAAGAPPGLLLLNAGIVHRIGPHRINVRLAREAAALGIASLRFDLSGRGDSLPAAAGLPYDLQAAADVRQAVAALCAEAGCERVMLFGICSGADDGLAAAMSEPRLAALVLFDPPIFPGLRWRLRTWAGKLRKFGLRGGLARFREIRRTLAAEGSGAEDNYGRDVPPLREYAARLRELAARGVAVHLVYSGSTCDEADYRAQCRKLGAGPQAPVQAEFMPDADHVLTTRAAQEVLLAAMRRWLAQFRQAS